MKLTNKEKAAASSTLEKAAQYKKQSSRPTALTFQELFRMLSKEEKAFAQKVTCINPRRYGFLGPYYGITKVPRNIIIVRNQKYTIGKTQKTIPPQLVPKDTYNAYKKLNTAMRRDIGKTILIESGYRSPAYQLVVFLHYLKHYQWNMQKTCKRVALPGYSEHGYPPRQALDFITRNGIPSGKNPLAFEKTAEYKWLLKHAHEFSFFLSYSRNNTWGVMFEPWHWAFQKNNKAVTVR